MQRKALVVIESPFQGPTPADVEINVAYARFALRDSLLRNEAPLASHLLYPQVLDDTIKSERALGIACGLVWLPKASFGAFYTDLGWSPGMLNALFDIYLGIGFEFKIRSLQGRPKVPDCAHSDLRYTLLQHCEQETIQ
jgi:hypothetical protein